MSGMLGKRGRTALLAGESIELSNGTIHGDGYCGGSYTDPNLGGTIMPGHPIDFVDAATKLQNMSAALKQYPTNGTQSKPVNNTSEVEFTETLQSALVHNQRHEPKPHNPRNRLRPCRDDSSCLRQPCWHANDGTRCRGWRFFGPQP